MTDRRLRRPQDIALAAALGCALLVGIASVVLAFVANEDDPGARALPSGAVGAESRTEAAEQYVRALNEQDAAAMGELSGSDATVDAAIRDRLAAWGGQEIALTDVQVQEGVVAYQASATLEGSSARGPYTEQLFLTERGGRWLVELAKNVPTRD